MPVLPLEVVGDLRKGPWVGLVGVSWPDQLGRREEADALFLAVIKAVTDFAPEVEVVRQGTLLHPEKASYDPRTMAYCPALACMAVRATGAKARVLVVDLRGDNPLPSERLEHFKKQTEAMTQVDRLLVLGDDPVLDKCDWLKLDHTRKVMRRSGVIWLQDDRSWHSTYEIPLMLKLTELGISLVPPAQQKE